jgi:hypothetical protein
MSEYMVSISKYCRTYNLNAQQVQTKADPKVRKQVVVMEPSFPVYDRAALQKLQACVRLLLH